MSDSGLFADAQPGGPLDPDVGRSPRRALIMAGGGLKVAFQAGVLQVWLDEARDATGAALEFMHADGASGGVFNLAMWCQGMDGHRIAENWRQFSPLLKGAALNWRGWARQESVFSMDRFRRTILRDTWGLDWDRIQATGRSASFNVFNVDAQRLVTLPAADMNEDLLVAATSLPFWYPPQVVHATTWIDSVFVTDANLDVAIEAGADELWIPWTVSTEGRWRHGPVAQYFQAIEACANGALRRDLDRIARNNEAIADGRPGEFGRPIRVLPLQAEVPLHYLFTFTRRRFVQAVDLGVARARQWCRRRGLDLRPVESRGRPGVRFSERMSGPVAFGVSSPAEGAQIGDARGDLMTLRLRAETAGDPVEDTDGHQVELRGSVDCPALGGTLPTRGTLDLLPGSGAAPTTMEYRLDLADGAGRALTLVGTKTLHDDPGFDLWGDTTTLDVELVPRQPADAPPVLTGTLRLPPGSLLRMLAGLRGTGPDAAARIGAVTAFGRFFLRRLAQVYGPTAPPAPPTVPQFDDWPPGAGPAGAAVFAYNERIVPAPPERVWELLVDARRWPRYYPNARFVRLDTSSEILVEGTGFRWFTFGQFVRSRVDRYEPNRALGWHWGALGAHGYHIWLLHEHEHGTRIVTEETQHGVRARLYAPIMRRLLPAGHDLWLRRIGRQAVRP